MYNMYQIKKKKKRQEGLDIMVFQRCDEIGENSGGGGDGMLYKKKKKIDQ